MMLHRLPRQEWCGGWDELGCWSPTDDLCRRLFSLSAMEWTKIAEAVATRINWYSNFWTRTFQTWWRHPMETFFALLALCEGNPPVTGGFPSQRPVTRSFDLSLICAWTNGWANNRDARDLRRHRVQYGVAVMKCVRQVLFKCELTHRSLVTPYGTCDTDKFR